MVIQQILFLSGGFLTASCGAAIYGMADFMMPGSVLYLLLPFLLFLSGLTAGCRMPFPHGGGCRAFFSVFAAACLFCLWLPAPGMDFYLRSALSGLFAGLLTGRLFLYKENKAELAAKCRLYAVGLLFGIIPVLFGTVVSIAAVLCFDILHAFFSVIHSFRQDSGKRVRRGWSLCGILILTVLCMISGVIQFRSIKHLLLQYRRPVWDPQVFVIKDFLLKHTPGDKISVLLVQPGKSGFFKVFSHDARVGKTSISIDQQLRKDHTKRYDLIVIRLPEREYNRLNVPFLESFKEHLTENGKLAVVTNLFRRVPEMRGIFFKHMKQTFPSVLAPERIPVLIAGKDFSKVRPQEDNPVFYEVAEAWLRIPQGTAQTAAKAEALDPHWQMPSSADKLILEKAAGNTPEMHVLLRYAQKLREYALPILLVLLGIYLIFRYIRAYQPSAVLLTQIRELAFGTAAIFLMLAGGDALRFCTDYMVSGLLTATLAFAAGFAFALSIRRAVGKPAVFTGLLILLSAAAYGLMNVMQLWSYCAAAGTALLTGFAAGRLFSAVLQTSPEETIPGRKFIFNIFFSFTAAIFLCGFLLQGTRFSYFAWIFAIFAVFFAKPLHKKG